MALKHLDAIAPGQFSCRRRHYVSATIIDAQLASFILAAGTARRCPHFGGLPVRRNIGSAVRIGADMCDCDR